MATSTSARAAPCGASPDDPMAMGGLVFIVGVILMAIAAPLLAPYGPNVQDLLHINAGPSGAHWLGTDDLGRDMLSRLIFGARPPLRAAFQIVGVALVLALPLALVAGFLRGTVDMVIMRAMDALFSFPPLVLALTVAAPARSEPERRLHRHRHRVRAELRPVDPG